MGFPVPDGPEAIRATLRALGLRPSRAWGQSFLADPFVADAEAALLESPPGTPVLEIGGGLGVLTAALVRRGTTPLTVVERDPRLAAYLAATFEDRVRVVEDDARHVPLEGYGAVIGNLPYSVGTPLVLRALAHRVPRVVFLLQREVAERFAAGPGSPGYGRLAIAARLYGEVELFRTVGRGCFEPRPEVDSRLGVHRARAGPLPVPSVPRLESIVRALFGARRKQLGNLLGRVTDTPADAARRADWPEGWERLRPENLPPEAFFRLATVLSARGDPERTSPAPGRRP